MQNVKTKTPNDDAVTTLITDSSTKASENQAVTKDFRIKQAEKFLYILTHYLPHDKNFFTYLWLQSSKKNKTVSFNAHLGIEEAARAAVEYNDSGYNVYVGVHFTDRPMGEYERPKKSDITAQSVVIADLDCKSAWHVNTDKQKYPSIEQAKKFLPFEPSILVDSGGGLHAYTLLKEPIKFASDEERKQATERNKNYIEVIRQNAGEFSKAIDGVHDLPRILRLPGTYNLKHGRENAPLCRMLKMTRTGYTLAELRELIKPIVKKNITTARPTEKYSVINNSDFEQARRQAIFDSIPVSELSADEWFEFISSAKFAGFSYAEIDAKNVQDTTSYNADENLKRFNSADDSSFGIQNLYNLAVKYGNFNEKNFRRVWYEMHTNIERAGLNMSQSTKITEDYISTAEAAKLLDVSTSTLENWRRRKLFGCVFFPADKMIGGSWYYLRERIEQLKAVYQKGILQNMYKLARTFSDNFQNLPSSSNIGFLKADEVSKILNVTEITLTRWREEKVLQEDILTHDGIYLYAEETIADFQMRRKKDKLIADEKDNSDDSDSNKLSSDEKFALFSLPHTDLYNAQRLSMFHGKYIRYLTDTHKWYTYHNNIWIDSGKENSAVLPFAHKLSFTITDNANETVEADVKLSKKWQKRETFSNAIELLKGVEAIRITEDDLNTHKNLLNCKNGVVDLQTGNLYPHDSKLLLTQCVNAEYRAGCHDETVSKFLRDVLPDEETLQALLRFLGYCLTGEIREEKALFIHGRGGNGKGTLTKMLLSLLKDYACGLPIETILVQPYNRKDGDSATPAFNKLQWRRLALAEEIPAGRKLDYSKFKVLTGGDALPIRKLYQESSEIKDPTHKMIFSGNHLPELDDAHDPGILRRWIQIKFEQDFTGNNCDETLKQRLQTGNALSAILTLLVENAMAWYKDGLIVSDKMKQDRDSYFAENDFVSEFISEFCERGNGLSVKRKDFLKALKAEYRNETSGKSDQELTSAVVKIEGITYRRGTGGGYKFFGITLKESESEGTLGDDFCPPPDL